MKSLVVLSALATIAIAAPSLLGEDFEDVTSTQEILPEPFKRDKKSLPEEKHHSSIPESGSIDGVPSIHSPELGSLPASARTLGLKKKPIIVKKKVGYHVYRDSDEERADSRENCPNQVKVKLCNAETKSNDISRSSTNEMTDGDMKHSIKMAKEAVENLQRDLKDMEKNTAIKTAPWKHGNPESDAEIQEDIEVARQALEHIHRNFGNLESMSLHATTSKDADSVQDFHVTIAETEKERMAQWKQAFENIQKNVEIARNIEDSFKTANHEIPHESLSINKDNLDESEPHKLIRKETQLRTFDNHDMKDKEVVLNLETDEHTLEHEKLFERDADHNVDIIDDMKTSPTTLIETKIRPESNEKITRNHEIEHEQHSKSISRNPTEASTHTNALGMNNENHDSQNSKIFEIDSPVLESLSMKAVEENVHKIDEEGHLKNSENNFNEKMVTSQSHLKLKASEAITELEKNTANKWTEHNLKQEDLNHLAKWSERAHAEHVDKKTDIENELHKPADIKSSLVPHGQTKNDDLNLSKSADQTAHHTHFIDHNVAHHEMNMAMKSADNMHSHFSGPLNTNWNQDKNVHPDKLTAMKATEEFKNEFMRDNVRNMHFSDQQHRLLPSGHHFEMSNGRHPTHMHSTMHGKSTNMDSAMQASTPMHMRDAMATFEHDPTFQQWKPTQEAARSAYGSGLAYGAGAGAGAGGIGQSGAVGVFPNANIGSCGIPLLLSCSPSVVSGSLKGHQLSSYGAPAYRNEDDFNFHKKRDTTKLKEVPETKLKQTPLTDTAAVDKKQ